MSADLTGKAAFVTGAAMGIGHGVADLLSTLGASVAMFDIDQALPERASELSAAGRSVYPVSGSVTDPENVAEGLREAAAHFGELNILINCAGVVRYGDAEELDVAEWDLQLDTNLRSVFLLAKYGVPYLRAAGGGTILSIASVQAFATQRGVPAYAASKGGIVSLTRSLAVDHAADGIRALAVAPGSVDTPMLRSAAALSAGDQRSAEDVLAEWGGSYPLGRITSVGDVARLVAFLVSDDAAMMTGTTVTIDGGLTSQIGVVR